MKMKSVPSEIGLHWVFWILEGTVQNLAQVGSQKYTAYNSVDRCNQWAATQNALNWS
jgi:hypothetical protein